MTRQVKPSENKHLKENIKDNGVIAAAKGERFWVSRRVLVQGRIQKL